jgi:hypothetical protein
MQEAPTYKDVGPMYTVEVFTKVGTDSEASREDAYTEHDWYGPRYI